MLLDILVEKVESDPSDISVRLLLTVCSLSGPLYYTGICIAFEVYWTLSNSRVSWWAGELGRATLGTCRIDIPQLHFIARISNTIRYNGHYLYIIPSRPGWTRTGYFFCTTVPVTNKDKLQLIAGSLVKGASCVPFDSKRAYDYWLRMIKQSLELSANPKIPCLNTPLISLCISFTAQATIQNHKWREGEDTTFTEPQ